MNFKNYMTKIEIKRKNFIAFQIRVIFCPPHQFSLGAQIPETGENRQEKLFQLLLLTRMPSPPFSTESTLRGTQSGNSLHNHRQLSNLR